MVAGKTSRKASRPPEQEQKLCGPNGLKGLVGLDGLNGLNFPNDLGNHDGLNGPRWSMKVPIVLMLLLAPKVMMVFIDLMVLMVLMVCLVGFMWS